MQNWEFLLKLKLDQVHISSYYTTCKWLLEKTNERRRFKLGIHQKGSNSKGMWSFHSLNMFISQTAHLGTQKSCFRPFLASFSLVPLRWVIYNFRSLNMCIFAHILIQILSKLTKNWGRNDFFHFFFHFFCTDCKFFWKMKT